MKVPKIAIIDSDISFACSFIKEFEVSMHVDVHHFLTFEDAYKNVSDLEPDFIITEYALRDIQDPKIITDLSLRSPFSKIIVLSNQTDVDVIEQLYSRGAFKYFKKEDFLLSQLKTIFTNQNNSFNSTSLQSQIA